MQGSAKRDKVYKTYDELDTKKNDYRVAVLFDLLIVNQYLCIIRLMLGKPQRQAMSPIEQDQLR